MRSLVCVVLLAACTNNFEDAPGEEVSDVETPAVEAPEVPTTPSAESREIIADVTITSPDCWSLRAGYEVRARYVDDGTDVPNAQCRVGFENGAASTECTGEHVVGTPGDNLFVVDVEDPATGQRAHVEQSGYIYPRMELDLAYHQPACGLEFDVNFSVPQSTMKRVSVTPAENIVGGNGTSEGGGHIEAIAPGEFTITAYVEQERTNGPLCEATVTRSVIVDACE